MKSGKKILLGITGSIAAYRALDIARLLVQDGHDVQIVATSRALKFFPRINGEVFTGHPVLSDLFESPGGVRHIGLADESDLLLVAPASADFIGRMAMGLADDLLTTLCLAIRSSVILAPAMEEMMYLHPAVQAHLKTLTDRGVREIPPDRGALASGKEGLGRLASPERIRDEVRELLRISQEWSGVRVLISAGPTRESIDPVRYIGNRSSGRMGYALVEAALSRGAKVTLVSGPVDIPTPPGADVFQVETAGEMESALEKQFPGHDLCIMAAAVADYRMEKPLNGKRKKDGKSWTLTLSENPDILAGLSRSKKEGQFLVGFAAETRGLDTNDLARKARRKGVDLLLANDVSEPGIGFGSESNDLTLVLPDGQSLHLGRDSKRRLADRILAEIRKRWTGFPSLPT